MLQRIEKLLLDLAVFAVVALCILITLSVVLRTTLNSGVPDTIVMVRELMVAAIVLPLAIATTQRSHIVVEFLSNKLPIKIQNILILLASLIGLFALLPLIYAGWREVFHTIESGAYYFGQLNLPKWPGRLIFLVGMSFCWIRLMLMFIGDIKHIRNGENLVQIESDSKKESHLKEGS